MILIKIYYIFYYTFVKKMTHKKPPKPNEYKLLLLGDTNVGKTSIFESFIKGTFKENQSASIGVDFETKIFKYKNTNYTIHLYDTAGQERFRAITEGFYHFGKGYFIVFDLTNENSLNSIQYWIDSIKEHSQVSKYIILGNKDDLKGKKISDEIINNVLNKLKQSENNKNIIYLKTSAKKNKNITKAFETMIDLIENENNTQNEQEPEPEQEHHLKANSNIKLDKNRHKKSKKEIARDKCGC